MLIHIQRGKGGRDRYVPLSPTLLTTLRVYYRWMRPKTWLFSGTVMVGAPTVPGDGQVSARVPDSQGAKTTVVRIEVAKSGDLAYEFSNSQVSFDLKDGKKQSFPNSVLRVWKKEADQWKIAAQFARPHYQEPTK